MKAFRTYLAPLIATAAALHATCVAASECTTNGISLRVELEQTLIAPNQDIVFTVTLKNVSGKPIGIYQTNRDDYRFVDLSTGTPWVIKASLFPPPAAPPTLSTFHVGKEWVHTVRLPPSTKFAPAGSKPEDATEGLKAGRYRLVYSTTFMDHYPDRRQGPWQGTLTVPAMEFAVAGRPATPAR